MAISLTIDSVSTADAVPTTTPFKISKKATKNILTFKFTPTATGPIRAWRARIKPTNRNTGGLVGRRGMYCGGGNRCGEASSRAVSIPSGTQITEDVTFAEGEPNADGGYEVKVWAASNEDGWSS